MLGEPVGAGELSELIVILPANNPAKEWSLKTFLVIHLQSKHCLSKSGTLKD